MDGIPFVEANEVGLVNDDDFAITRFEQQIGGGGFLAYRADVLNAELVARDLTTGAIVLEGGDLEGARFEIRNVATGIYYYLTVFDVRDMQLWAQPDPAQPKSTNVYRLQWSYKPGQGLPIQQQDICGPNEAASGGGPMMSDFFAVLFDDDRIDVEDIRVVNETPDWFTIGCAGSALAKQHLLAHTKAAGAITQTTTTLAQRSANLKMITADYCGIGAPMTVPGQELLWRDANNWYDSVTATPGAQLEARWDENGAICLNIPRVDYNLTPLGWQTFQANVEALLPIWCRARPPTCRGDASSMSGAHVISVQPW